MGCFSICGGILQDFRCRCHLLLRLCSTQILLVKTRMLRTTILQLPLLHMTVAPLQAGINPLHSFFNLQSYAQGDWDHPDFSEILVALVKACETRDLLPVVECVFNRNKARQEMVLCPSQRNDTSFESAGTIDFSFGASTEVSLVQTSIELDCYRTILYLARYQCTTAFHAFFPTTIRACKGAHFWCAQGTKPYPIFDRAFREAAESYGKQRKLLVPIPMPPSVALA